jgi:uncharacterized protein (TIGR02099 family)
MIQRVKKPIKYCWMSSAIVIIVFAILLQFAKWSLPYINYFNVSLEGYASKQVNARVSLGRISAKWTGLRPQVMVDGLIVESHSGQPLLAIKTVSMRLDILLSLYHWTPVWHSVQAAGVDLHVAQDEAGGWSIGGISPVGDDDRSWRYRSPSALFLKAGDVKLESSQIFFTLYNQRQIKTDIPLISIQNNGHFHRLNAKAAIGDNSAFNFILEGVGDPSIPDQFFAQGYLQLNRFPVERLSQLFGKAAVGIEKDLSGTVAESEANLNVWLDFATPSRFLMNGHIELINDESSAFAKKYYLDIPLSADMSGDYSIKNGLSVGLSNVTVDKTLSLEKVHVLIHDNKISAALDKVDLRSWLRWSEKRLIRSEKINSIINKLAPAGQLINMANIVNAQTEAWRGVPEFKKVSGYLEVDMQEGFVLLDAYDFSLFPDKSYSTAIISDYASGFIGWKLNYKENKANIVGYDLKMLGDYGDAKGNFSLDVAWDKGRQQKQKNNLTLQIGLKDSNARFHQLLVPKLLSKKLLDWMSESIKSGEVSQAGLFYRGGLAKGSNRTVQFFADIDKGELDFSPDWPALKGLKGRFLVDNNRIVGEVKQASVYKGDRLQGDFYWNQYGNKVLTVKAAGNASAESGLRYLRKSWLRARVGDVIEQVSGSGRIGISVDLDIPLNNSRVDAKQIVKIDFNNNQLKLNDIGLVFNSVKGKLNYFSDKGFVSEDLNANLFDQQVSVQVSNTGAEGAVLISGNGSVAVEAVAEWLNQPILSFVSGVTDYLVKILIPANDSQAKPSLSITSNLLGVAAQFPQPLDKKINEELPFVFTMPFDEGVSEYKLILGQYFSGRFFSRQGEAFTATVAVSDVQFPELTTLPDKGLKLVSQFTRLDAKAWFDFFADYTKKYPPSKAIGTESVTPTVDAFISTDTLVFNDYQFKNMMLSGHREQNGWSFFVDSKDILGGIYIDEDGSRPWVVDIDYLYWPPENMLSALADANAAEQQIAADVMDDIDLRHWPLLDVEIDRLVYKDKPLGHWSMQFRPNEEGIVVNNIVAALNGFTLAGQEENRGATLRWLAGTSEIPESTVFSGIISGGNPKNLFEQWKLPFGLESEQTWLDVNLFWLGSPGEFAVENLQGQLASRHTNGIFTQERANDATGVLRLFGLFNFDSWARRVRLDFSDVYKEGIVFDELKGGLTFSKGIVEITQPITMQGPSSKMSLSGSFDYLQETVDARLVATVPIGGNLTVVAALVGGLPVAAGVYLVSKFFEKQVEKVSSINYLINGSWSEPVVIVEKLGDKNVSQPLADGGP